MDECTQVVGTQDIYDPRRMGRNNSGLNDADISDVLCILHPATPAAFRIVSHTADRAPQYVLQNSSFSEYQEVHSQHDVEEAETFVIGSDKPHAMDLALRFSANLLRPELGFVFGRNPMHCDVVLDGDTSKRISNLHFRIYINNQGVLMLEDASTNGTVVDEQVLNGKPQGKKSPGPPARMLQSGSVIQIVSPKADEIIKFILRIPQREGHEDQFQQNFHIFMEKVAAAQVAADKLRLQQDNPHAKLLFPTPRPSLSTGSNIRAPVSSIHFGMHWSGGDKYSVVGNIGKGAFATVYQIATKTDGQLFAAKELDKRRCMKNGVLDRKVTNEMQIMQTVNHPNIVQYIEYRDFEHYLYIIMEYIPGGDLQQYLARHGQLSEKVAKRMSFQVLEALDYLHRNKITHRDIKPDNILLANTDPDNFTIKLSDFGLSKVVADDKETFLKTFCGTLLYCAPEVFPHYDNHVAGKSKKRTRRPVPGQSSKTYHSYSQSVDIWSFAAVLWYSLCMEPPFEGVADRDGRGMFEKIMMTPLDTTALVRAGVSDTAIALLIDMLNTDPAARPTPAMCLQHPWFGGKGIPAATTAGLGAIAEEHETEAPDVASLSIGEQQQPPPSQSSQLSINSADYNFFDPRQSKRFKSNVFDYREHGAPIDSSPEVVFDRIPIVNQVSDPPQKPQPRLFGEISQSVINAQPIVISAQDRTQSFNSEEEALALQHSDPKVLSQHAPAGASPSLLGAESLVRELKMHSPAGSGDSLTADDNEPATPHASKSKPLHDSTSEITPRPPQASLFNRQISIPFPPSLFWDSGDPSTHNNDYASKVSGHDFGRNPSIMFPAQDRNSGSATDKDDEHELTDTENSAAVPSNSQFLKPSPRLGKLISTADSFKAINLTLTKRLEDWGRAPSNTQVYPDGQDTRIPKRGIIIWFFASGIEKYAPDDDTWTKLPDLQACIMTEKRGGITINGVLLPKNEPDRHFFGRLYTGDEIEVFSKEGQAPLKLICEFFHGIGRESRPQNVPPFSVEKSRERPLALTSSKGKENAVTAGAERSS